MAKYAANTAWLLLIDKTSFSPVAIFCHAFLSPSPPMPGRESERERARARRDQDVGASFRYEIAALSLFLKIQLSSLEVILSFDWMLALV